MFSLFMEVKFWSLRDDICISDTDLGVFRYNDKRDKGDSLWSGKRDYAEKKGYKWYLPNKRPDRTRDHLKEIEEYVKIHQIIDMQWWSENVLIICFSSGLLTAIKFNIYSGDVDAIICDKYLKEKLNSEHISDIIITNSHLICCFYNTQLVLVTFGKSLDPKRFKKISRLEPKISTYNLPGYCGRRFQRNLAKNKTGDTVAVWWNYENDELFPWRPTVSDVDRANIYVYNVNANKLELLCYYRTDYLILNITFSSVESNVIYAVEHNTLRKTDIIAECSRYEIIGSSRLQKTVLFSIQVFHDISCVQFSPDLTNLLITCIDGSVVLYNQVRGLTHLVKAAFVPVLAQWHPDGTVAIVASDRGQFQCFDFALCCVKVQLIGEDITPSSMIDLSPYLRQQPFLQHVKWCRRSQMTSQKDAYVSVLFNGGPIVLIKIIGSVSISSELLVKQYVNMNQLDQAVNLLLSLSWDAHSMECYNALKIIANHVLTSSKLAEKQVPLQIALSSFYSPIQPISHTVESEYSKPVRNIGRRFFYSLLRYGIFDTAFKIADDLNEHDLYMSLYYGAKNVENMVFAVAAWKKAERICNNNSSSSVTDSSTCDDCSCSEYSGESEACDRNSVLESPKLQSSKLPSYSRSSPSFANVARVVPPFKQSTYCNLSGTGTLYPDVSAISRSSANSITSGYSDSNVAFSQPHVPKIVSKNNNFIGIGCMKMHATFDQTIKWPKIVPEIAAESNKSIHTAGSVNKEVLAETDPATIKVVHFGVV